MNKIVQTVLSLSPKGRDMITALQVSSALRNPKTREDLKKKVNQIAQKNKSLTESSIENWRTAHQVALNVENPQRSELHRIYRDTLLDLHLKAVWGARLEMVLKSKFVLKDENGNEDTEATKLLKKSWFLKYMTYAMESRLWGHSLIQFDERDKETGLFTKVSLVDRDHVKPEKGIVTKEATDEKGWSYLPGGPFYPWVVPVGEKDDLGLLLELTPAAISKKYMGQFWDEFGEIFSVPIRIGRTNTSNKDNVDKMAGILEEMGRSAWGVLDNDSSIEIVETGKKDAYQVYDKRIERANGEMSKAIAGQTMVFDDGSSKSQAEVHLEIFEQISNADRRFLMFHMNEELIPFLIMHGYPFEGLEFEWNDENELSFDEQLSIDKWLAEVFEMEIDYFQTRYTGSIKGVKQIGAASSGGDGAPGK